MRPFFPLRHKPGSRAPGSRALGGRALAVAALLVLAGCAEIGEPVIGSLPISDSVPETVLPDGTNPDGSTATTGPQPPPARPEGFVPSLVIATESGVVIILEGGEPELLDLAPPVSPQPDPDEDPDADPPPDLGHPLLVIDDFFRGLVVQFESGAVQWFQAEGGEARTINLNQGRLLEVSFFDGTTEAIMAVGPQIDRVRLVDTQRLPLLTLQSDDELLDLSAGGGLYASAIANSECGQLLFLNAVGEEVLVSRPPAPTCESSRRPFYGSVALKEDGGAVAYTEVTYRADGVEAETKLVVIDLAAGAVALSKIVGESGDRITGLSFDGQRVAMMREAANAEIEVLIVSDAETITPDLSEFGQPVAATWARIPVAVGSVE